MGVGMVRVQCHDRRPVDINSSCSLLRSVGLAPFSPSHSTYTVSPDARFPVVEGTLLS